MSQEPTCYGSGPQQPAPGSARGSAGSAAGWEAECFLTPLWETAMGSEHPSEETDTAIESGAGRFLVTLVCLLQSSELGLARENTRLIWKMRAVRSRGGALF